LLLSNSASISINPAKTTKDVNQHIAIASIAFISMSASAQ